MTWGDVGAFFAVLVVGSLVAGFVDAWLQQRKWDKKKRGSEDFEPPTPFSDNRTVAGNYFISTVNTFWSRDSSSHDRL